VRIPDGEGPVGEERTAQPRPKAAENRRQDGVDIGGAPPLAGLRRGRPWGCRARIGPVMAIGRLATTVCVFPAMRRGGADCDRIRPASADAWPFGKEAGYRIGSGLTGN